VSLADGANALMTSGPRGRVRWVIPGIVLLGGSLPSGTMDLDLSDITTASPPRNRDATRQALF